MGTDELPALLLMEVAHKLSNMPEIYGGAQQKWKNFSEDKVYPQLQAAAQTFLGLPPRLATRSCKALRQYVTTTKGSYRASSSSTSLSQTVQ